MIALDIALTLDIALARGRCSALGGSGGGSAGAGALVRRHSVASCSPATLIRGGAACTALLAHVHGWIACGSALCCSVVSAARAGGLLRLANEHGVPRLALGLVCFCLATCCCVFSFPVHTSAWPHMGTMSLCMYRRHPAPALCNSMHTHLMACTRSKNMVLRRCSRAAPHEHALALHVV